MQTITARHISNNLRRQADIFSSLSLPDLEKIVYNLRDANDSPFPLIQISGGYLPCSSAKWSIAMRTSRSASLFCSSFTPARGG
jgi:hypothetical protein